MTPRFHLCYDYIYMPCNFTRYDNDVVLGVTEDTESAREMYDVPTSR